MRDSGQLPVDCLVGFTIFILSLIMVANFVPSLLVGLQRTSGIDYDAVAYRTGVVLVEDPGEHTGGSVIGRVDPSGVRPWEQEDISHKDNILRFGLAVSPDTPNILSINKINRFFDTSFFTDTDYRNKLLFSTYQYGYNITLKTIPMKPGDPLLTMSVGEPYPAGYGYIRRYVLIKQNTNATIDMNITYQLAFDAMSDDQVKQELRLRLNGGILYNKSIDTPYKIDLLKEPFTIRITNLSHVLNNSALNPSPIANNSGQWAANDPLAYPGELVPPTSATLTAVQFYDQSGTAIPGFYSNMVLTVDPTLPSGSMQTLPPAISSVPVIDTIELSVQPLWPSGVVLFDDDPGKYLEIGLVFQNEIPHTLVTGTFLYDYFNVTRPALSPGMLEVGIW